MDDGVVPEVNRGVAEVSRRISSKVGGGPSDNFVHGSTAAGDINTTTQNMLTGQLSGLNYLI